MVPKIVRGTTLGGDHFSYDRPFPPEQNKMAHQGSYARLAGMKVSR